MIDGILNLCKEKGMTSQDAVAILRGVFGQKRIGHTGTLDPDVTGVLPICLGRASKLADYISQQGKTYQGRFRTGLRTDTLDSSGEVLERREVPVPDLRTVQEAAQAFTGPIDQLPPMYSAVQVGGKRLYALAREGKEVERKARKIYIGEFTIEGVEDGEFSFRCTCSKGTYVRQLVDDLGEVLGSLAVLTSLERVQVGPYRLEEAISIQEIRRMDRERARTYLLPMDSGIQHLDAIRVGEKDGLTLFYGQDLPTQRLTVEPSHKKTIYSDFAGGADSPLRLYVGGQFAGLVRLQEGKVHLYRGLVDIEQIRKRR